MKIFQQTPEWQKKVAKRERTHFWNDPPYHPRKKNWAGYPPCRRSSPVQADRWKERSARGDRPVPGSMINLYSSTERERKQRSSTSDVCRPGPLLVRGRGSHANLLDPCFFFFFFLLWIGSGIFFFLIVFFCSTALLSLFPYMKAISLLTCRVIGKLFWVSFAVVIYFGIPYNNIYLWAYIV